jgi:hypothetical protein
VSIDLRAAPLSSAYFFVLFDTDTRYSYSWRTLSTLDLPSIAADAPPDTEFLLVVTSNDERYGNHSVAKVRNTCMEGKTARLRS